MRRAPRTGAAILALACLASPLRAQVSERSAELFLTGGAVGGLTPVSATGHTYFAPYGGGRLDVGVQGEQTGFGIALRVWEAARTHGVGTAGADVAALGEFRASRDAHTLVRVSGGMGFESVDSPNPPPAMLLGNGTDGFTWSVGVAREVFAPGGLMLVSVDLVMPPVSAGADGRRAPVVELGLAFRSRFFHSIAMPGSRGGR